MPKFIDMTGKKFNRLVVFKKTNKRVGNGGVIWIFKCDCGTIKEINGESVRRGLVQSCGCLKKEVNRIAMSKTFKTHGMSTKRIWWTWAHMRQRCTDKNDPSYKHYGGRGIKICKRWLKFENFYEDMKVGYSDSLSIDRIDNDGNYEPDNCRWATKTQQARNTRTNHFITHNGITKTLVEWAEETGIKQSTIRRRLSTYGWNIKNSLTKGVNFA